MWYNMVGVTTPHIMFLGDIIMGIGGLFKKKENEELKAQIEMLTNQIEELQSPEYQELESLRRMKNENTAHLKAI